MVRKGLAATFGEILPEGGRGEDAPASIWTARLGSHEIPAAHPGDVWLSGVPAHDGNITEGTVSARPNPDTEERPEVLRRHETVDAGQSPCATRAATAGIGPTTTRVLSVLWVWHRDTGADAGPPGHPSCVVAIASSTKSAQPPSMDRLVRETVVPPPIAAGDATNRKLEGECFGEPDALIAHVRF